MPATVILQDEGSKPNGSRYEMVAWSVPQSDEYPEGLKYSFQYMDGVGETLLRYDNTPYHLDVGRHHRHTTNSSPASTMSSIRRRYASPHSPSTLRITALPAEQAQAAAVDRAERWERGEEVPHVVNFEDRTQLRELLTDRRLELMEEGRAKKPFAPYGTVRLEVELWTPSSERSGSSVSA